MKRYIVKIDSSENIIPRSKKIEIKPTDDVATLLSKVLSKAKPHQWFKVVDL